MSRAPFLGTGTAAQIARYEATLAIVADLRGPPGADRRTLRLASTEGLDVGDAVELRNEYQLARSNFPAVQRFQIVAVEGDEIVLDGEAILPALSQQGAHVLKRTRIELADFDVAEQPERSARLLRATSYALDLTLDLVTAEGGHRTDLCATRKFATDVRVLSERIRIAGLPPLAEVYRKNRKVDRGPAFQRDYNVDRQGALFGSDQDAVYVYGAPEVSSLRVVHPASEFHLTALTASRPFPNDPMAAVSGELAAYASLDVPAESGSVVLDVELTDTSTVTGVSIHWYHLDNRPETLRVLAQDASGTWNLAATWHASGESLSTVLLLDQALTTGRIRLELDARRDQRILAIRLLDILVGADGFELEAILDDHRDHRYCRYLAPELRTEEMGRLFMESRSTSPRRAGEVVESTLTLRSGPPPRVRPRISHVPNGGHAMLVWTEHADRTTLESHRAAYLGSSAVESPDAAIGGFVAAGIPVTKSVFADNPRGTPCSREHPQAQAAIRSDARFEELCRSLARIGHEICVHAPWPGNSPPPEARSAAEFMAREFGARTWIDHSAAVVHCGMSGQGLNETSPYCMSRTWLDHGYDLFWQFACEDASEQRVGSINVQQIRLGDKLHTPLWWTHERETGPFRSWATIRGGDLDVYTDTEVAALLADRGVCVTHTYPAALYDDPARNQYLTAVDGELKSSARFESVLACFAERVASGELIATTIRDAMRYWEAIERVEVIPEADGTTLVVNRSSTEIEGLTLVVATGADAIDTYLTLSLGVGEAVRLDCSEDAMRAEPIYGPVPAA